MAQLREIRNTDPMRFMVAAAVNEYTYVNLIANSLQNNVYKFFLLLKRWLKYAKEGDKPTLKVFRDFMRTYYKNKYGFCVSLNRSRY